MERALQRQKFIQYCNYLNNSEGKYEDPIDLLITNYGEEGKDLPKQAEEVLNLLATDQNNNNYGLSGGESGP
eukprot:UN06851